MPNEVAIPTSLAYLKYFVLRYHRDQDEYELIEPNRTHTWIIGNAEKTRQYFWSIGMEYLGGRAMDSALAFGASQAIIKDQRAFGLDLCKVDVDAGITRPFELNGDDELTAGVDGADDFIFVSGLAKPQ